MIVVSELVDLDIQIIRFSNIVDFRQVKGLARAHAANTAWASSDVVHLFDESAAIVSVRDAHIDLLRRHYRELYRALDLIVLRRAGWVCRTAPQWRVVEHFLRDRHALDGQATELTIASELDGLYPLFTRDEIHAVSRAPTVELFSTAYLDSDDHHS